MYRKAIDFLNQWLNSNDRKPLVIRGARQVGKTWIVRHLAETNKKNLIEINFEKKPEMASLFTSNDPAKIILNLSTIAQIDPKKSILFLDEIQAVPILFAKLRWFAEDMPELPIIAAGSLLEFVLAEHSLSMPVGRINYMHLEPLSFQEFLLAHNKKGLFDYLKLYQWNIEIPQAIHEQLMSMFKEYIIIGGMPQAVSSWIMNKSLQKINQIHSDLIATYRDDFAKYSGRIVTDRLNEVMNTVPLLLGKKFMYSKVNPNISSVTVKQSLDLLFKAKVCHRVAATAANGLPLAAEIQDNYMKVIFLDVGLCSSILGLSIDQLVSIEEIDLLNKGGIAEQVIGQILRTIPPVYIEPSLYYWQRHEKGSSAEIDYIITQRNNIIPIEVKSGSTGTLKSLHLFMNLKKRPLAVRINSYTPYQTNVNVKDHLGNNINYQLLSIPFYLIEEFPRLLG